MKRLASVLSLFLLGSTLGSTLASTPSPAANGDTALVTGATRGIELEFARQYAAGGPTVIATARKQPALRVEAFDVASDGSITGLVAPLQAQPIDVRNNGKARNHDTSEIP